MDAFIGDTEPYKLAKDEAMAPRLAAILYQSMEAVRIAGVSCPSKPSHHLSMETSHNMPRSESSNRTLIVTPSDASCVSQHASVSEYHLVPVHGGRQE